LVPQLSSEIKSTLEHFKRQGEDILRRLNQTRQIKQSPFADIGKDVLLKGVGVVAGRTVRKYTRRYFIQQQTKQKRILEVSFESEFYGWFTSLKSFLETVSIKIKNISQSNSDKLIQQLIKQLRFTRVETKIKHTLKYINQLLNRQLIFNKDIPSQLVKEKREILIKPSTPFSGMKRVREILTKSKGYVKVLDPYVDTNTLDVLFCIPQKTPIMLLTENLGGAKRVNPFLRSCKSFKVEKPQFQIRKCEKGLLHDRYKITRDKAYSTGSSLKDLGKRLSSIIEITEIKADIEKQFDNIWTKSNRLI